MITTRRGNGRGNDCDDNSNGDGSNRNVDIDEYENENEQYSDMDGNKIKIGDRDDRDGMGLGQPIQALTDCAVWPVHQGVESLRAGVLFCEGRHTRYGVVEPLKQDTARRRYRRSAARRGLVAR